MGSTAEKEGGRVDQDSWIIVLHSSHMLESAFLVWLSLGSWIWTDWMGWMDRVNGVGKGNAIYFSSEDCFEIPILSHTCEHIYINILTQIHMQ